MQPWALLLRRRARATTRAACAASAPAWAAFSLVVGACSHEPADPPTRAATRPPGPAQSSLAVVGKAPAATGSFPSAVVLEPQAAYSFPVPTEARLMDQFGNAFSPSVLVARQGQPVEFTNSEEVLHNVHVVDRATGATVFNVATLFFSSYEHTFERAGVYDVSCDIHPGMAAVVLVVSTPYAVVAEPSGDFSLSQVRPGTYHVRVWNIDPARQIDQVVEVVAPRTELNLEAKP